MDEPTLTDAAARIFGDAGAMIRPLRAVPWAATAIGAPDGWPEALAAAARLCLASPAPLLLWWGPDLVQIHNASAHSLLDMAPGQPALAAWAPAWPVLGPALASVLAHGHATTCGGLPLPHGVVGGLALSPLRGAGGAVAGVFGVLTTAPGDSAAADAFERDYRSIFMQAPASISISRGPDHVFEFANPRYLEMTGRERVEGLAVRAVFPEVEGSGVFDLLDRVYRTGEPFRTDEFQVPLRKRPGAAPELCCFSFNLHPLRDHQGAIVGLITVALEITGQVRARQELEAQQAALRASEESLSLAVEATGIGIWDFDIASGALRWSNSCRAIWGLAPDAPVEFATWIAAVHADDRPAVDAAMEHAMRGVDDGHYEVEFRMRRLDNGDKRWLSAAGRVFFAADGRPRRFIGTTRDTTARKRIEARRAFLDRTHEALAATLDPQEQLRAMARAAVPLIADWCVVDLVRDGARHALCHVHDDPQRVTEATGIRRRFPSQAGDPLVAAVAAGGARLFEDLEGYISDRSQDPEYVRSVAALALRSSVVVPIRVHGVLYAVVSLITAESGRRLGHDDRAFGDELARHVALAIEHALLYREATAARGEAETLNTVGASVASELEPEKVVQAITDAGTRVTGAAFGAFFYNVPDPQGGHYTLYTIAGVPRERFAQFPMPRATALFGPTFRGEGVIRLDDVRRDPRFGRNAPHFGLPAGHLPVVSYLAVPVRSRSGEIHGGLFFGHDQAGRFDERHERLVIAIAAQAAIAIDNARLFEAERGARELAARQAAELQRTNAELEQFAYISSHDLQEPLRTISQYLELLTERYRDRLDERGQRYIGYVRGSALRMYALINDLLAYSRTGQQTLAVAAVELGPMVEGILADLAQIIGSSHAEITVGPLGTVVADRVLLRQALQNFITNALKFTREGPPQVAITWVEKPTTWEITIADQGLGIAPADHANIFKVFQRLNRQDQFPGSGIGLAICQKIAQRHGGSIAVDSELGRGTAITLVLPRPVDGAATG